MAVANFNFRGLKPTGWTANSIVAAQPSVVGPANAAAQNPVSAQTLMTTPQTLSDPTLGSRAFMNPNTGIRDVAASGSVYAMSEVPPYLSQAVSALSSEQALQRSLQAEWNNRLMQQASGGGKDAYLWLEALRAASVSPGASVNFGGPVQNPALGRAAETSAIASAALDKQRTQQLARVTQLNAQIAAAQRATGNVMPGSYEYFNRQNLVADLQGQLNTIRPIAQASAGSGGVGGWSAVPRPTNSFQPGYQSYWG